MQGLLQDPFKHPFPCSFKAIRCMKIAKQACQECRVSGPAPVVPRQDLHFDKSSVICVHIKVLSAPERIVANEVTWGFGS